ncbi:LamG-like jellyroll fold domain-containing protein [Aquiflexum lacus]|uniref:LamG-like jellyroll fold domain-containing protein n=1 Tax=Aquiflexum lacus TaxID=2483805 RepID=UPI001893E66E|nr:LamG-like jellyroll fold domain-containing protein [Aquiflexum lacus]
MNKSLFRTVNLILIFFISLIFNLKAQNYPLSDFDPNHQQVIAFPGAEGFGKYATGGRGGQVLKVTNLNDDGPGSLRAAVQTPGARTIIFEVSGNINLTRPISVKYPNVTIAGQTAPGDGITITNYKFIINSNNTILRYIRFRLGDKFFIEDNDALEVRKCENVIIDHCSLSWGTDETGSFYGVKNFTLQWSILSEGLNKTKAYGGIWGGNKASYHHNLFAHFSDRNPLFDHPGLFQNQEEIDEYRGIVDFQNNVIYNWGNRGSIGGSGGTFNYQNNYLKPGPATIDKVAFLRPSSNSPDKYGKFFILGNYFDGNSKITNDNWDGVRLENGQLTESYLHTLKLSSPLPNQVYEQVHSAESAYEKVLESSGANLVRDIVDLRIINETLVGTYTFNGSNGSKYGIIDSQKDVGGWPILKSLAAPSDTDGDGIPNNWEIANGLDPNIPNDKEFNLSPYYTDIEVYVNSIVQDLINKQNPGVPIKVSPTLPKNNETVSPVDISFAWQPLSNAQAYRLQISKNSDFSSNVITINNIKNYSLVYPELDANSTFFWRIRASNTSGNGQYSAVLSFKTGNTNTVPGRTILLSPETQKEGVGLSPIFKWAKVPNADSYRLQVSIASDFSSYVINQSNIELTEYQSIKLQENKTYYWRVRASNAIGNGSNSLSGSFKTLSNSNTPKAIIPVSPLNNVLISPLLIHLNWVEEPSAETYQIQVATDSNFNNRIYTNSDLTESPLVIPNLDSNKTYYWRIRGRNRSGAGIYSSINTFKTSSYPSPPEQVEIISPENDINVFDTKISFLWKEEPIAQSYRLQLSTSSNFNSFVSNIGNLKNTTYTISNLSSNTQYFWRVIASNEAGDAPASEIRKVRTATYSGPPPATNLISPVNQAVVGATSIVFDWENQPNTETYRLEISEKSDFSSYAFLNTSIRGTSFEVRNLNANKTYFWRVRTANPDGRGERTETWSFKTIEKDLDLYPPSLLNPQKASNFSNNEISFSWESVGNATEYHLQISELTNFSTISYQNENITGTKISLNSLSTEKAYFWRVRAKSDNIFSAWSDSWNFSIGSDNILLKSGLVGYWPMEEGGGNQMIDQSGNKNNATIQNTSDVIWVNGKSGKAISLNGNTGRFGVIQHNSTFNIPSAITLAGWVKPKEIKRGTIFYKSAGNGFEFWFDNDGYIEFRLNRSNNGTKYRLRSNFNYSEYTGKWIHVAATFDGSNSKIFINGMEDASETYQPFNIGTTSGVLVIGASGSIQRWTGEMDDLRLYNRSLTENEILKLTGETTPSVPSAPSTPSENLLAYYKMDEGGGNKIIDHSGYSHDAIIQNTGGVEWKTGKSGQAISLNGFSGRYGLTPHNNSLELPNQLTLTAWVKPSMVNRGTIFHKSDGNGFELWLDKDGKIEFRLNRGNNASDYRLRSNFDYSSWVGKWIHVAATFDGKNSKIFINGQEDISESYEPFGIGTSSGDLVIGALGTIQRWQGELDELRIYDVALNLSDIQEIMDIDSNPSPVPIDDSIVGYWTMEEGSGSNLLDQTKNSNHAKLQTIEGIEWIDGVLGKAIDFKGQSGEFAIAPHNSSLEFGFGLSISAWVKPSVVGRNTIMSKSAGKGFELWLDKDGFIEFRLNRSLDGPKYKLKSSFNYQNFINSWFHVAATFDGNTARIFINGLEDASSNFGKVDFGTQSGELVIGAMGTIQRFSGGMDELILFKKALQSSEILDLAQVGTAFRIIGTPSKNVNELELSVDPNKEVNTDLTKKEVEEKAKLYPNPVTNELNVASLWVEEGKVQVYIYDIKGSNLLEGEALIWRHSVNIEIEALNLKPGNYLLVLQDNLSRQVFRFIKK